MAIKGDGRPTIHDVALEAGVSYQTVSRVLNNSPKVAASTRQRVQEAIRKLDYQPIQAARNLALRRSQTILIITFNWNHSSLRAIVSSATRPGYSVVVVYLQQHDFDEFRQVLGRMASQLVDGAIVVAMPFEVEYDELLKMSRGLPIVQIGGAPNLVSPLIAYDQVLGSKLAIEHLLHLGHTRIAGIHGSKIYAAGPTRHETLVSSLRAAGLEPGPNIEADWTCAGGYAAARQLLQTGYPFTALFCGSDLMALGAMRALQEAGLSVPQDVSVIGFDDITEAAYFSPPLTTVRQDFDALGRQSVQFLISLIEEPEAPVQQRFLIPQLVVRSSTRRIDAGS